MNKKEKKAQDLALETWCAAVQTLQTEEEVSRFCQMTCAIAAKAINGIEGRKFKKDFLQAAIRDKEIVRLHPKKPMH